MWEVAKAEVLKKRTVVSHGPDREVSHIMAGGNVKPFKKGACLKDDTECLAIEEVGSSCQLKLTKV